MIFDRRDRTQAVQSFNKSRKAIKKDQNSEEKGLMAMMVKWYVDNNKQGIVDSFEEAEGILASYGLRPTGEKGDEEGVEYWTKTGDMNTADGNAYEPFLQIIDKENDTRFPPKEEDEQA